MRKLLHASVSGRAGCFHFHSIAWPNHGKENPAGSPFEKGAIAGYFRRNRFGLLFTSQRNTIFYGARPKGEEAACNHAATA